MGFAWNLAGSAGRMGKVRLDQEVQRGAGGLGLVFLRSIVLGKAGEWLLPLLKQ